MDGMGSNGYFVAMGSVYAVYGLYALWRSMRSRALDPSERDDFRVMPPLPAPTPESLALDVRTTDATPDPFLTDPYHRDDTAIDKGTEVG